MSATPSSSPAGDRRFFLFNAVVSAAALSLLTWLLVLRTGQTPGALDLRFVPAVNACLNGAAAGFLVAGWAAIRRGNRQLHRYLMVSAFAASSLFLVGYLAYHYAHGDTRYAGAHRGLYLSILGSHVLLSLGIVPMALSAFFFAWKQRFSSHRKVTRLLLPAWLYVSVTGIVIYFMLHG